MKGASPPSHGKESWKQSSQNKKTDFFRHEGCETLISIRTSLRNLITQVFTLFSQPSLFICASEMRDLRVFNTWEIHWTSHNAI
jgi:hypothetical protein